MSTHISSDASASASPPPQPHTAETHLEELGQHSWVKSLFNTLTGTYGSAQFRFVARAPGDHDADEHIVVGDTFPVMRFQDLNNRTEPNAWIDTAVERFRELDAKLAAMGWARDDQPGAHWWSRTYQRSPGEG